MTPEEARRFYEEDEDDPARVFAKFDAAPKSVTRDRTARRPVLVSWCEVPNSYGHPCGVPAGWAVWLHDDHEKVLACCGKHLVAAVRARLAEYGEPATFVKVTAIEKKP
jgi:hypothetical protein